MLLPPPPPPPQAGANMIRAAEATSSNEERLRGTPAITTEKSRKALKASQSDFGFAGCSIAAAAVVVMLTLTGVVAGVPVAEIEAGLNTHFAPVGSPEEQEREIVPLKLVEEEMLKDVCPVIPGAEMVTIDGEGPLA